MTTLVTLPGVEILATGTWRLMSGEATFTSEDLANAVAASWCLAVGDPIIKLGHVDPRFDGEPAVGRVENLHMDAPGDKLTGDLVGLPEWLGEVMASAYPNRSIEGFRDYVCAEGHTHPFAITGLALLGVTPPGVQGLNSIEDVAALYGLAAAMRPDSGQKWRITMTGTTVQKRTITHAQAEAIVDRNIRRGAIPEHRRGAYLAIAARGDDLSVCDELVAVPPELRGDRPGLVRAAAAQRTDHTYDQNRVVAEVRETNPGLVQAAEADGPAPRLFGTRDLPVVTASGIDPHLLAGLPWMLRRPVAAAPTMQAAYSLIDQFADAQPDDMSLLQLRYSRENGDYIAAVSQWLSGAGLPSGNAHEPQGPGVAASAARDDAERGLYRELFGTDPED